MTFEWPPHLCTPHIQLSVRSLSNEFQTQIQTLRPGRISNSLKKRANIVQSKCAKLLETYSERLTAVITAKGDSNMYWLRGVNTYVNEIFLYFIFNKRAKMSKNMFSCCHYWILCVEGWEKKPIVSILNSGLNTTKCGTRGMNASEGTVYLHSYLNDLVPLSIILVMVLPAYRHTDLTHYCHLLFTAYSFLASLFLFFIPFDLIFNSALLSTDP
jgi:hypothetical protein